MLDPRKWHRGVIVSIVCVKFVGLIPVQVKPKSIKLVFANSTCCSSTKWASSTYHNVAWSRLWYTGS
jgi:hypothetical protein